MSEPITNTPEQEPVQTDDKLFTQADVDEIVTRRLAKEKAAHAMEIAKRDKEIKRQARLVDINIKLSAHNLEGDGLAETWADLPDETVERHLAVLDKAIRDAVDEGINARLRTSVPKAGTTSTADHTRQAKGLK